MSVLFLIMNIHDYGQCPRAQSPVIHIANGVYNIIWIVFHIMLLCDWKLLQQIALVGQTHCCFIQKKPGLSVFYYICIIS